VLESPPIFTFFRIKVLDRCWSGRFIDLRTEVTGNCQARDDINRKSIIR